MISSVPSVTIPVCDLTELRAIGDVIRLSINYLGRLFVPSVKCTIHSHLSYRLTSAFIANDFILGVCMPDKSSTAEIYKIYSDNIECQLIKRVQAAGIAVAGDKIVLLYPKELVIVDSEGCVVDKQQLPKELASSLTGAKPEKYVTKVYNDKAVFCCRLKDRTKASYIFNLREMDLCNVVKDYEPSIDGRYLHDSRLLYRDSYINSSSEDYDSCTRLTIMDLEGNIVFDERFFVDIASRKCIGCYIILGGSKRRYNEFAIMNMETLDTVLVNASVVDITSDGYIAVYAASQIVISDNADSLIHVFKLSDIFPAKENLCRTVRTLFVPKSSDVSVLRF